MELYLSAAPRRNCWERWFSEADWDAAHSERQAPRCPIDVLRNAVPATATIICQNPLPLQRLSLPSPIPSGTNTVPFSLSGLAMQSSVYPYDIAHVYTDASHLLIP
jgi:hypothetical protein